MGHDPIIKYLEDRDVKIHTSAPCRGILYEEDENGMPIRATGIKIGSKEEVKEYDVVVAALDVPGIKKVLPKAFRKYPMFDNIYNLECVPIATVQVRFDGWVTEMTDDGKMMDISGDQSDGRAAGIDNLLYSAD